MVTMRELQTALDKMILSASGWRGVFAIDGDEESKTAQISEAHRILCGAASFVFAEFLGNAGKRPQVLLGSDTRPTGKAIIDVMIPVLISAGCDICYAGVCAAPEILAWAKSEREASVEFSGTDEPIIPIGLIYISASHNPVGHNGIKFGLSDGGVLPAEKAKLLINNFYEFLKFDENIKKIEKIISFVENDKTEIVHAVSEISKINALKAYYEFCTGTAFVLSGGAFDKNTSDDPGFIRSVASIVNKNIGIVCDFNGSARAASIDKDIFDSLGLKFDSINSEPGGIAHRIVPEGESLESCKKFLEEARTQDPSFVIGYMPDCDGDRGNLVIWDDSLNKARALEAQEVFALACVAEFAYQVWLGEFEYGDGVGSEKKLQAKNPQGFLAAIAVNDPTSMRIDSIAETFGVEVFRAEVGEANVVSLARKLRKEGYTVRILGEGSAGGNITHPSAVRDPIHTVLALVKLICIKGEGRREKGEVSSEQLAVSSELCGGLFEIWCRASGQMEKYRDDFTLADIIDTLPKFVTTSVYEEDAVLRIKTKDHAVLKDRYQKIFEMDWEKRKEEFKKRFGFCKWEAIAYNGLEEKRGIKKFGESGRGGLKVLFYNEEDKPIAYIWMRGSATEPVFRIMADIEGEDKECERLLLKWQSSMIMEADLEGRR